MRNSHRRRFVRGPGGFAQIDPPRVGIFFHTGGEPIADVVVLARRSAGRGALGDILYVLHFWPLFAADTGTQLHFEFQIADLDAIAVVYLALAHHSFVVDESSV